MSLCTPMSNKGVLLHVHNHASDIVHFADYLSSSQAAIENEIHHKQLFKAFAFKKSKLVSALYDY